jgi:hypothetical protein
MQEFLLTLVVIFVLFKIFGNNSSLKGNVYTFTQNNYNPQNDKKQEGKVSIDGKPGSKPTRTKEDGEYVDYEEIK